MQDVVRDILNGNKERFREIVQRFSGDLLRIAYHFVRDWDDAQDLTQDSLIRCYQHLRRYDPQRPFRPWLYRIHVNVCKAAVRRGRGRKAREVSLLAVPQEPAAETTVDESALILSQVARLSARQRAAFILVEMEGLNPHEAAYILKCADSTLRVHLARAKRTLRENLIRLGIGDETLR